MAHLCEDVLGARGLLAVCASVDGLLLLARPPSTLLLWLPCPTPNPFPPLPHACRYYGFLKARVPGTYTLFMTSTTAQSGGRCRGMCRRQAEADEYNILVLLLLPLLYSIHPYC